MKNLSLAGLLLVAVILNGCGENFPDEEMHFGIENKVRPYAVIIEPPEAAPGETVTVTLLARTPDLAGLDISWKVALDFDRGIYETDEVERLYSTLDPALPEVDDDGFLSQSFEWVVPESAFLTSSALPEILDDPAMVFYAEQLLDSDTGSPLTKSAVDAYLKSLDAEQVAAMAPPHQLAALALADYFACQVRFRATLRTDLVIDVTKNLTIRHTGRLGGPNANHNAEITSLGVAAIAREDATISDLRDPAVPKTRHNLIENGVRVADRVMVPTSDSWTYYLEVAFNPEQYFSPFEPERQLVEQGSCRWYYYRQDAPTAEHHFFVTESGDEAEMENLDHQSRIMPDGIGSTFRFLAVVRDERGEWAMYNAVPGTGVEEGIVEFVAP